MLGASRDPEDCHSTSRQLDRLPDRNHASQRATLPTDDRHRCRAWARRLL